MGKETTIEVGDEREVIGCASNLAVVLRCLGASGVITLGVVSFMDMLTQLLKPHRFSFDLFMVVFCLFSLLGEMWTTSCMKGFGYSLLKHTYFITTYGGRGIWYIFIGTCNLDDFSDKPFTVIVGIFLIGLGLLYVILSVCMRNSMPKYSHPEHMKEKKANKGGKIEGKSKKGKSKKGDEQNEETPITSDQVNQINEDDLDPYEKRLLAEERRKEQEKNQTYKIANPFGEGNPYAAVASTVVRNGDAPAVAKAVVKGDNTTAASTVARSVVLGPQSGQQQQHQPPSQPSAANPYANYSLDDDDDAKKKPADDDDELERQYAAMFAK